MTTHHFLRPQRIRKILTKSAGEGCPRKGAIRSSATSFGFFRSRLWGRWRVAPVPMWPLTQGTAMKMFLIAGLALLLTGCGGGHQVLFVETNNAKAMQESAEFYVQPLKI